MHFWQPHADFSIDLFFADKIMNWFNAFISPPKETDHIQIKRLKYGLEHLKERYAVNVCYVTNVHCARVEELTMEKKELKDFNMQLLKEKKMLFDALNSNKTAEDQNLIKEGKG